MRVGMKTTLEELREDHRNVEILLGLLEIEIDRIGRGESPDYELLADIMQYMTVYADAVHHPKEDLVYAKMRALGGDWAEGLEQVEPEHRALGELGARLRQDIGAIVAGAAVERRRVVGDMRSWAGRLQRHMRWEEDDLFPRADALAAEHDDPEIDVGALARPDPLFGEATPAGFETLVKALGKTSS